MGNIETRSIITGQDTSKYLPATELAKLLDTTVPADFETRKELARKFLLHQAFANIGEAEAEKQKLRDDWALQRPRGQRRVTLSDIDEGELGIIEAKRDYAALQRIRNWTFKMTGEKKFEVNGFERIPIGDHDEPEIIERPLKLVSEVVPQSEQEAIKFVPLRVIQGGRECTYPGTIHARHYHEIKAAYDTLQLARALKPGDSVRRSLPKDTRGNLRKAA